jgi:hypothetical protein
MGHYVALHYSKIGLSGTNILAYLIPYLVKGREREREEER